MDINTATKIIQNITDAMGGVARVVTVTVKPYKGDGSRSFRKGHVVARAEGLVIRPEGPMCRPYTPESTDKPTAEEALAHLIVDDAAAPREAVDLMYGNFSNGVHVPLRSVLTAAHAVMAWARGATSTG